jgi:hypothetical protein
MVAVFPQNKHPYGVGGGEREREREREILLYFRTNTLSFVILPRMEVIKLSPGLRGRNIDILVSAEMLASYFNRSIGMGNILMWLYLGTAI